MKKTYDVEVDCANCAAKMEEEIKKIDGISNAVLSFMTLKLKVDFEEGANENKVMKNALKACRKVESDCEIYF
ncbi:MAG: cation transporter [Eubacterium sp.]|nr:cation transporter [Eubacterium sp.]